jgi:DNA-binding transcriptional regulator YiaG
MPNIATVLKDEIARIARKQIRGEIDSLKKASTTYRTEIAALKRRAATLEQDLKRLQKATPKVQAQVPEEASSRKLRFSAKGLAAQRQRLGLSAEDCGRLIGASGQSVYNWEAGTTRPRASHLAAIAALKTLGKKSAAAHLDAMKAEKA